MIDWGTSMKSVRKACNMAENALKRARDLSATGMHCLMSLRALALWTASRKRLHWLSPGDQAQSIGHRLPAARQRSAGGPSRVLDAEQSCTE